jgi:peptidoglycan/xylan/chitin deacetylase (PgdA/CDA1 family)
MNFWPLRSGLRVLMYHKVSEKHRDGLTVTMRDFKQHLQILKELNIQIISLAELIRNYKDPLFWKKKSALLTFDDGYQNNAQLLFPYIHENKIPITVFIPVHWIGKVNEWDKAFDPLMNLETLKLWQQKSRWITYGLHSFLHQNYKTLSASEVSKDLSLCASKLDEVPLDYEKVLAYPYGGFPKNRERKQELEKVFSEFGMQVAFRIGNRINKKKPGVPYFLERLDIRGDENLSAFIRKVKYGKIL